MPPAPSGLGPAAVGRVGARPGDTRGELLYELLHSMSCATLGKCKSSSTDRRSSLAITECTYSHALTMGVWAYQIKRHCL